MSFDDFAARMKAKKQAQQTDQPADDKPYDFAESYKLRARMVGVLLRDARLNAARTIEDCARLLGVTAEQMQSWEYGDEVPTLPQLELLAYYLDVPVSHFWGAETLNPEPKDAGDPTPQYVMLRNRMVGALLRQAREEAEMDYDDLAEHTGLTTSQIESYEMGEAAPPMHELSVMAGILQKNLDYFLEPSGQIGELLALRESWKHFAELPEDVRKFASDPKNIGFIHIAVLLSQMPADQLREVGASILDITM